MKNVLHYYLMRCFSMFCLSSFLFSVTYILVTEGFWGSSIESDFVRVHRQLFFKAFREGERKEESSSLCQRYSGACSGGFTIQVGKWTLNRIRFLKMSAVDFLKIKFQNMGLKSMIMISIVKVYFLEYYVFSGIIMSFCVKIVCKTDGYSKWWVI